MKIILCEDTRDVEKVAKLLDRNLRKVTIEFKKCPPEYDKYKDTEVVAKVEGKVMHSPNAYGLLKEIRKFLKKEDKLDLLDKSEMKKVKKEFKAEQEREKEKREQNLGGTEPAEKGTGLDDGQAITANLAGDRIILDAPNEQCSLEDLKISVNFGEFGQENSTYEVVKEKEGDQAIGAHIQGDRVVLDVPNENFRLEDMKISVNLGSFGDRNSTYEVVKESPAEQVTAELNKDEIILTVPNEQFSLDKMKLTVNFGSFGEQNSTYEVVKKPVSDEEKIRAEEEAKAREVAQVATFSAPEPKETKAPGEAAEE